MPSWVPDAAVNQDWFDSLAPNYSYWKSYYKSSPIVGKGHPYKSWTNKKDWCVFIPSASWNIRKFDDDGFKVPVDILAANLGPRESRKPEDYETLKLDERYGCYGDEPVHATLYMISSRQRDFSFYCARVTVLPRVEKKPQPLRLSKLSGVAPAKRSLDELAQQYIEAEPEGASGALAGPEEPERTGPYRYLT